MFYVTSLLCCQVNRGLYGAPDSLEAWSRYLDHIDDKVQEGLSQLLLRSLHFLSDSMSSQVHTPENSFFSCVVQVMSVLK